MRQVRKLLHVSQRTVYDRLVKAGFDPDEISKSGSRDGMLYGKPARSQLYHEHNEEIECACGCGGKKLRYDVKGIERKFLTGHANRGRPSWRKLNVTNEEIVSLYHKHKSSVKVAEILGCTSPCVCNHLKEAGVSRIYAHVSHKVRLNCCVCGRLLWRWPSQISDHPSCGPKCERLIPALFFSGPNSPFWDHGQTVLSETIRGSQKYIDWRTAVFQRDDYTCQNCSERGGKLNAHHVGKPLSVLLRENGIETKAQAVCCKALWRVEIGRTLCTRCHEKTETYGEKAKHYKEAVA